MYWVIRRASSSCSLSSWRRPWPQFPAASRYTTKSCSGPPFYGSGPLVAPSFEPASQFAVLRSCGQAPWCGPRSLPALLVAWRFVPRAHTYRAILLPLTTATSFPLVTLILLGVFVAQAVRRELTAK